MIICQRIINDKCKLILVKCSCIIDDKLLIDEIIYNIGHNNPLIDNNSSRRRGENDNYINKHNNIDNIDNNINTSISISSKSQITSTISTLLVPTNPYLTTTQSFPYFPRGSQPAYKFTSTSRKQQRDWTPPGFVSSWRGMEIGAGMCYSAR